MAQQQPFFSVIIPTYNRPQQLATCLRSLGSLRYPRDRFEVIVVDDGSTQDPEPAVAGFDDRINFTLLRQPHGGPGAARNTGAACARGTFLAYTGDDCAPASDWLQRLAECFAAAPGCAIGGQIRNTLTENPYSTATHLLIEHLYSYYNVSPTRARFFTPNNLAVPADLFRAMGGFDVSFAAGAGEDREFCDRWLDQGYRMAYVPEAVVYHAHPLTFSSFWQLHFRYGRGTFRYRWVRAGRRLGQIRLEPLRFYCNLLRKPFAQPQRKDRSRLAALLGISQVANAAGFFWEGALSRMRSRKPSPTLAAKAHKPAD